MKTFKCQFCGTEKGISYSSKNKYCSNKCQHDEQKQNTFKKLLEGKLIHRGMIRQSMIENFGRKCSMCHLEEWQGHPIPIEVDHIDGDAGNNSFNNLRLLCPNCHGITPTWKGKNKGNGRASRGLPLS